MLDSKDIINEKWKLGHLLQNFECHPNVDFKVYSTIHDVNVCWHIPAAHLQQELLNYFSGSPSFEKFGKDVDLEIFWKQPEDLGVHSLDIWNNDPNPDCRIRLLEQQQEVAVQRDFVAVDHKNGKVSLLAPLKLNDGLFNFLRWWLPRKILNHACLLLHSSCVVDDKGQAYFCLGPSGAGKSTIASLAKFDRVLGDDMNIIECSHEGFFAKSAKVGQMIENRDLFGQRFPVAGFFWLKHGARNHRQRMTTSQAYLKIMSCCANLFWETLTRQQVEQVQALVMRLVKNHLVEELEFNLIKKLGQGEVWDYVTGSSEEIQ